MRKQFSAIAFIIVTMAPLSALAYTQEDADACTPDAMRLCQAAIPDPDRVTQCLLDKRRELSPECKTVFSRPKSVREHNDRRQKND
ncbi:MAG TPA: hypothetical protein VHV56_01725 [Pseudolabrys sp.]|jgi:hypothetical protein|nr:hypothetical protein [Pseudolabrys sp.]